MTGAEFGLALDALKLTRGAFSRVFGVDPRTTRRYVSGDTPVPRPVEVAIELLLRWKKERSIEAVHEQLQHVKRNTEKRKAATPARSRPAL